jgi:hypothetical protein
MEFRMSLLRTSSKIVFLVAACLFMSNPMQLWAQGLPEVAPGLTIPDGRVPYALDVFQGKQQLVPVPPSSVQLNNHRGSNVAGGLVAGPFFKPKATTELAGAQSQTLIHSTSPIFYLHTRDQNAAGQSMMSGWAIVRATASKDGRLLATVKFNSLTGNAKRSDGQMETKVETLPGNWLRISCPTPLLAGEYALVPVIRQGNAFSLVVYDFRIDPAATENSQNAIMPQ